MRKIALLFSLAVMTLVPARAPGFIREGRIITIAAGTEVQVSTQAIRVDRIFVQALPSASGGLVYVFDGVKSGTTPAFGTNPAAVLCAATSTTPGCSYGDSVNPRSGDAIILSQFWIDGAHTGDKVVVSWNRIN